MTAEAFIECPFCGSVAETDHQIMLHIENYHPEDKPSLIVDDVDRAATVSTPQDGDQFSCCLNNRGETVSFADLDSHLNYHSKELSNNQSKDQKKLYSHKTTLIHFDKPGQEYEAINKRKNSENESLGLKVSREVFQKKRIFSKPGKQKVVSTKKSELGPYAKEKEMPVWLVKLLRDEDGKVKTINRIQDGKLSKVEICSNMMVGVIPVLAQLLDQEKSTEYAFLCHPSVMHISKLKREGGFCGYRNIQMLCSYVNAIELLGHETFGNKIPSIFEIQEYIEMAWDIDINFQGRLETGGIRGTRKFIGTPEAQAMFFSLGISCIAEGIRNETLKPAFEILFDTVEKYFNNDCVYDNSKLRQTLLAPVYLQHAGHSLTIIGFEKKKDGTKNIIVFDPSTRDNTSIIARINQTFQHEAPENLLKPYRKGATYWKKHDEFEILKLSTIT